jgi:hypothetical protein
MNRVRSAFGVAHDRGWDDWQELSQSLQRADFDDTPPAVLLPIRKARAGQRHTTGP